VVLHHRDGFLRPEVAGLLHPAASHEVRRVSCYRAPAPACARQVVRRAGAFPTTPFIPLEEFHPIAAVPHHCGRCPLAVAIRSSRPLLPVPLPVPGLEALPSGSSTSRLSSAVGSVTLARWLPVAKRPILPWALFPFEVFLRTAGSRALDPSVASSRASGEAFDPRRAPLYHLHTLAHIAGPMPLLAKKHPGWRHRRRSEDRGRRHLGTPSPPESGAGASNRIPVPLARARSGSIRWIRSLRRFDPCRVCPEPKFCAARGPLARRFPGGRSGRQHRPSWGS
jgi:hypothetical protein